MFRGSATALITPFNENGVDYTALEKLIEFQISGDTDALVVCGTTGEPATMSTEEKDKVIDFCIKHVNHRIPVIVGTGCNSTATAVANSVKAEKAGADGVLVVTPYYNKCTQKGLIEHYKAIDKAIGLPIVVYNVPGRTGVNIQPTTLASLCELKNIAAMKEASGNISQIAEMKRLCGDKIVMYSGDDGIVVPVLSCGGEGVISVASNIAPKYMHDMVSAYLDGNTTKATKMQLDLLPLVKALFCEVNPIPVKMAAAIMNLCRPDMRLPLTTMEDANANVLKAAMTDLKLI